MGSSLVRYRSTTKQTGLKEWKKRNEGIDGWQHLRIGWHVCKELVDRIDPTLKYQAPTLITTLKYSPGECCRVRELSSPEPYSVPPLPRGRWLPYPAAVWTPPEFQSSTSQTSAPYHSNRDAKLPDRLSMVLKTRVSCIWRTTALATRLWRKPSRGYVVYFLGELVAQRNTFRATNFFNSRSKKG
jgi:hypothetical protein